MVKKMSEEGKKPFCIIGGECIGNVPTKEQIDTIYDANSATDYWDSDGGDLVMDGGMNQLDMK